MRRFHRNWITYEQAFGRRVCVPHHKPPQHRDFCCDFVCMMCKKAAEDFCNNRMPPKHNQCR